MAELLAAHLPKYEIWFHRWRARRDQMKLGAHFRTAIDTDPPRIRGICFAFPRSTSATDIEEGFISLDDVIVGLDMSTELTEVARALLEGGRIAQQPHS